MSETMTGGSCPCGCGGGPLPSECLGAEGQIATGLVHLRELGALVEDFNRLRRALEEIAGRSCGIPGHSVAVGCGCPERAREALDRTKGHGGGD